MNLIVLFAALSLAAVFFLPTISVANYTFSAFTLTKGVDIAGLSVISGNPIFALELILPLLLAGLWLKGKGKKKATVSMLAAIAQLIMMIISMTSVKQVFLNAISPSATFWFILAVILTLLIIVVSLLVMTGKIDEHADVSQAVAGAASAVSTASAAVSAAAKRTGMTIPKRERVCPKCGNALDGDSDFCVFCGTKYVAPKARNCPNCGYELDQDDEFCPSCGAKYIEPKEKICSACGKQLSNDEEFCPYCGAKYVDPDSRICRVCGSKIRPGADFCGKCGTRFED